MDQSWTYAEKSALGEMLEACAWSCRKSADACLGGSDPGKFAESIRLVVECAKLCEITAGYLDKGSAFQDEMLRICAEACDNCRNECERHMQWRHFRECADASGRCETACHAFSEASA